MISLSKRSRAGIEASCNRMVLVKALIAAEYPASQPVSSDTLSVVISSFTLGTSAWNALLAMSPEAVLQLNLNCVV